MANARSETGAEAARSSDLAGSPPIHIEDDDGASTSRSTDTSEHREGNKVGQTGAVLRRDRLVGLFLPALLVATILAVLLPAVVVQQASGVVLLKLAVAGLLSILPGWLYLQFIKNKGQSLYDEYVLNLFRLHIDEYQNLPAPPQHTSYYRLWATHHKELGTDTKDNLYRKKFEAIYGRASVSTFELIYDRRTIRAQTETFAPVLFATVLLCIGWVLVLQPERWRELDFFRGLDLSGAPRLPNEMLRFGFLGAYAFILQDLVRRYFRDDLKTGAYISGVARLVFVTLVLTALQLVSPFESGQVQQVVGFMVGFFPQVGLQAIHAATSKPLRVLIPTMKVEHPLSELDGLNIWYEARLAEEGIEDMQNLVTANLVDLMLRTRAPIARLVDWIDQALLYLHLPTARDLGSKEQRPEMPRSQLRRIGIRTASDLERAWGMLQRDTGFCSRISASLGMSSVEEGRAAAQAILAAVDGNANFWHVREFKRHEWLLADARRGTPSDSNGLMASVATDDVGQEMIVNLSETGRPASGVGAVEENEASDESTAQVRG